ncbi:MAG: hypothetical protein HY858_14580 [Candidatus Solibacter usitatus]|nr:hypothetical protein [Candidatus Solibacter usitatus]
MPHSLRHAWTSSVTALDYETHMAAIGQAQANALHIADFLARISPPPAARVLIAGAGTGQMFTVVPPGIFDGLRPVFSDINPAFLACLRQRVPGAPCVADDLEHSALRGPFFAAAAVLVLEHIDWRKGLDTLARLALAHLFLVIQSNPPHIATAVSPHRTLPGTMAAFSSSHPNLMHKPEVLAHLATLGYDLAQEDPRPVADGKVMLGLSFRGCCP